ncbi:acetyl-CoA carboxylase biotin carboxylase subunit [Candidimonas nitroreducens]|uniref:Acetyl-CoA carboxylase biotin carboxylase subunit n=1 Tax=Candidimonas nitroreducens TaxID=683354 RepID=A0A225MGT3_9BURK|nr:biotin carboxylase N-terminal domain-containing protein [Candidimonas nitroreducens]OWT59130.1 acetyl-CoA carboxylase biotin carboxylase subunit [Candidimonas nitroreducens]
MKKVLIANRGEIACRIIRSCRRLGIQTVAVYSEVDADSKHVVEADEAYALQGKSATESYLRVDHILEAARRSGADGIHPGYGFLAENAEFARQVERAGIVWIGPTPDSICSMGDKERARLLAEAAGVPVLPGSTRFAVGDTDHIIGAAASVGFPLLVKAAAGGGGIGMRRVDRQEDLLAVVKATQQMAERSFGDGTVYLERYVSPARHVEVQVFGFGDGRAIHLHERDCSIQRRFQKIIEESPAPGIPIDVRERMLQAALSLCRQERYRGAGTVEFVVDARTFEFFFLEMNTRIQVEHPVTEMVAGVDLVAMQLQLAAQQPLAVVNQIDIQTSGHSIECRLYAERPSKNFLPSTGILEKLRFPTTNETFRLECGVREGDRVTHFYDPMIGKIICHGADRPSALRRMLEVLAQIEIEGVQTNIDFLMKTVSHEAFKTGMVSTSFIEEWKSELLS